MLSRFARISRLSSTVCVHESDRAAASAREALR
jgi:hypothetical protein